MADITPEEEVAAVEAQQREARVRELTVRIANELSIADSLGIAHSEVLPE